MTLNEIAKKMCAKGKGILYTLMKAQELLQKDLKV